MEAVSQNLVLKCTKTSQSSEVIQENYDEKVLTSTSSLSKCLSPSLQNHLGETVIKSNHLTDDSSDYVTENSKQTVTILYPQSGLSLLSTNNGELVNIVELPHVEEVDGSLELDSSLEYQGSVVLEHNFEGGNQIVVSADHTTNEDSIAYFKSGSIENSSGENTLLTEQLIIPTSEVVASGHTISLPLSFVNDSGGVSLLQSLSHLPLTLGDDNQGEISVPVNIQAGSLVSTSENGGQRYIISNITSSLSQPEACADTVTISSKSQILHGSKNFYKQSSSKGVLKLLKSGQVGRPPKVQHNKIIGFGSTAISAQGVVQEIGNRLVTVLPRPEDLKKLMDNKQLILAINGNNSSKLGSRKRLPGLPKYPRFQKNIDKEFDENDELSSTGGKALSPIHAENMQNDDEDFIPKSVYMKRKSRKRKRGRGRGRGKKEKGTLVISSTGRRPGRPKKVKTIMEGPKGPRVIQTGSNSSFSIINDIQQGFEEGNVDIIMEKEAVPDFLKDNMEVSIDADSPVNGIVQDDRKRKLPPRNRGVKYKKLILALKKQEYEDDDFDFGDEDSDSTNSLLSHCRPHASTPPKPKGNGKRGRPRKHAIQDVTYSGPQDLGGTKIIQLNEALKQIHSTSSSSILVKDENTDFDEDPSRLQHKLVITFEQPETGEMVMQHIAIQPQSTSSSSSFYREKFSEEPTQSKEINTNIVLVSTNEDSFEEENATIFVEENGEYEEGFQCSECGDTMQYKRDFIRHLRLKHNLRPYECAYCGKTFTSKMSLQHHTALHDLETPHRCSQCGKGFDSVSQLKLHVTEHNVDGYFDCEYCGKSFSELSALDIHHISCHNDSSDNKCQRCNVFVSPEDYVNHHAHCYNLAKSFECDICRLQFVSSSGLNRHRKVHNRSSFPGMEESVFRCSTCQASFSFESSLLQHIKQVHDVTVSIEIKSPLEGAIRREKFVIEQLQKQLNEGYAPKTSELYDEPEEAETIEQPSNDPFKCGICDESFKDIDVMCDHYSNSHMGDQLLYCDYCGVGCAYEYQLEKHKSIHTKEEKLTLFTLDSKDTPYICSLCGRGFRTDQEFAKHSKYHNQDKQFKCSFCSASFLIKSALDKHILVHTGQRPYVCDICLKSFRQSAALVRHKLWTHRLKNQNKCEVCGKTFFTQNLLLYHLDSHGEEAAELKSRILNKLAEDSSKVNEKEQDQDGSQSKGSETESKKRTCEYCGKVCPSLVALLTHKITHKLSASYKCDLCHRTFRERRYLKKHKLTHRGLKVWKCDICFKAFATKLTLIRHSHVHLREALKPDPVSYINMTEEGNSNMSSSNTLPNELKCVDCNREFVHKSHYVRHKLLHAGIPLLKCGLCDKMFVHKSDIIRHKVMHSFMFSCNLCGRNFHKRTLYVLHMKKHMDAKPFKCEKCDKSFATSGNFKIHQRIHSGEKPYHCNMCSYRCSQSGRLLKHKRMHSGEKSASCNVCGKSFSNTDSLKSHQRIHTGERPFRCGNCDKSFTNNTSLNQHVRDHVREEMFKCDQCSHKFRRSEHLEKHKLFHKLQHQFKKNSEMGLEADTNIETPLYMCDTCGRVFEKKKYLYTHHNVHSRQKLYSCNVCGKHLASRLALRNHLMIHTGEMPHKCAHCEKEFRSLSNLKRHEKVHGYSQDFKDEKMDCYDSSEILPCDECGETLYSLDMLNEHKQAHVNLMMINAETGGVSNEVNQQLYVFGDGVDDNINETMDPSQQLIVENTQQQFLVDNAQSLLVFPETGNEAYEEISPHSASVMKTEEVEAVPSPSQLSNDEDIDQDTQSSFIRPESKRLSPIVEEREVDKPHRCDVCFKSFAKKQYLTKHKYRHREVKPHACDVCGKRFAQKFEVAVHKIKHTGERPYRCEICKKEFRSKVNLINHRMRHTGEYPYLCSVCNKGLSTQIQLERHVSLHTGAHPFRCEICNKGFFQRVGLKKHLVKGHSIHEVEENYDTTQSLQTSENLEVMEAISTIANIPPVSEEKHAMVNLITRKKMKEEVDIEVNEVKYETMDMASIEEFAVVREQQDYLLSTSQEIDAKFFNSILQGVRVDETDCDADTGNDNDQVDS